MKKLFTLLSLFLCFASGAWAIETDGAMNGVFSVSSTKKVVFSQGNLQYVGTWQFAEKQWDCFSTSQSNNHRDLFGWGTGDAPNKVSKNNSDYSIFTDWGANAITNGGNTANVWRTLTKDEWVYLFYTRENAATLFGFGNVAGVNGLIILPDDWKTPEGASFTASTTLGLTDLGIYYHNANNDNYTHNTYTAEQWAVMESADAVFLPAAAYRNGTTVDYIDYGGFYWSSTPESANNAYYLNFYYNDLAPQFKEVRYGGRPVRLVADAISYTVPSSGIGTFSTSVPVVLPEGLEAYTCKTYDSGKSTISTQKVEGTIPANTGVLIKGTGGETYTLVASSQTPEAIEDNALIAVTEATHVDQTEGEYTNFMMKGGKFIKIAASSNPDEKMPANRAYLQLPTASIANSLNIEIDWKEETGIRLTPNPSLLREGNIYYTLDGRKLNGIPAKGGVYINNGKKVIK